MAKKFDFRYESILKLRAEKVTQAQESLNQAVKVRLDKEKSIEDYKNYKSNINITEEKSTKAADLQNKIYHKQHIENEIKKLEKEKRTNFGNREIASQQIDRCDERWKSDGKIEG